ncbi:MAG: serine hydrolase family protein [Burkholderiaceae bacterium]|nr:serine hydrolase family protein [Pseudomonadota bacterium]MBS0595991.1 serine hydrolase family protein [Pseudomonadota bacterium]MCO5116679.1 alpha/beta hydrolase [Burkholderiaceae bacterium]MCP5218462.1 serine hydrolase family protein [Burkholderiaceae bacterium]
MSMAPTLLLIPGLRDEAPGHWQAILASQCPGAVSLPALGRRNIDLAARLVQIEEAVQAIKGPVVVVAHSGGTIATAHWAQRTHAAIHGALLATPPLFAGPLGPEFPDLADFQRHGWVPIPRSPLPFRCIVAASRNDPLGAYEGVSELARDWGASLFDLGESGHLNPASGFGPWPTALDLVRELALPAPIPMN